MLCQNVRSLRRNAFAQSQCYSLRRRIHATGIHAVDDPQKSNIPEKFDDDPPSSAPPSTAELMPDAAEKQHRTRESEGIEERVGRRIEKPDPPRTGRRSKEGAELFDEALRTRQKEREDRVAEVRRTFRIPQDSLRERSQRFRQTAHDEQTKYNDESSKRGAEVFRRVNAARAARGEAPIGVRGTTRTRLARGAGKKLEVSERLERRIKEFRRKEAGPAYKFSESFNPSESYIVGEDEVDYELAYTYPEKRKHKERFSIAKRNGTKQYKTNRDFDRLPEDASSFIPLTDLGPVGRTFYSPSRVQEESEDEVAERIMNTQFPETSETDVQELFDISRELAFGMNYTERQQARQRREIDKVLKARAEATKESVNVGTWGQFVPMPRAHKPETADLDKYVPPVFTHASFRFGVPPIPVGTQGRLHAAGEVKLSDATPLIPSPVGDLSLVVEGGEEAARVDKAIEDLTRLIRDTEIAETEGPLPTFNRLATPPQPVDTHVPYEPKWQPGRVNRFEDVYDENQTAVWREMHKDHFAPPGFEMPDNEDEEAHVTEAQEAKESQQRVEGFRVMERVIAATMKSFRRRDEWEIRDIRRRLGLPIVADQYQGEPYYGKRSLNNDGVACSRLSNLASSVPASAQPNILKGEIVDQKPQPPSDDTAAQLEFWQDCKTYLTRLSARIEQLRKITHETSDRIRYHGTAEIQHPSGSAELITQADDSSIMQTLHSKFLKVHKRLEQLEMLTTAMLLGPAGPLDREYSDAWIEHHLHEDEKIEFEATAVGMGFAPNSVPMEPSMSEDQRKLWEHITRRYYQYTASVGIEGEYEGAGYIPAEGMTYPMDAAARLVMNSGMDAYQKAMKVNMLAHKLQEKDFDLKDPLSSRGIAKDEDVKAQNDEAVESTESLQEANLEDFLTFDVPVRAEPGERIPSDYASAITAMRKSIAEIDGEVVSLEDNYDDFLKRNPRFSEQFPTQNPTQEASP